MFIVCSGPAKRPNFKNMTKTITKHFETEERLNLKGKFLINKTDNTVYVFAQISPHRFTFIYLFTGKGYFCHHNRVNDETISFGIERRWGELTWENMLKFWDEKILEQMEIVCAADFFNK